MLAALALNWPFLLIRAGLGVTAGIGLHIVASPAASAAKLAGIFTAWVFLTGIGAFLIALALRRDVTGEWPLPTAGVISLICGITLGLAPPPPSVFPLIVGGHSVLVGLTVLALTLRRRQVSYDIAGR